METSRLELARRYLQAIEANAREEVLALYDPEAVQREYPNRLSPQGATRRLSDLAAAGERGRKVVAWQRYEVLQALELGDDVALRVNWSAELAMPVGSLKAGDTMRASFAVFLRFREGRILEQHNYDCFEPF